MPLVFTLSSVTLSPSTSLPSSWRQKLGSVLQNSVVLTQPLVVNDKAIVYSRRNMRNFLSVCSLVEKAGHGQNCMAHKLFTLDMKVDTSRIEGPLYEKPKYKGEMLCLHSLMEKAFPFTVLPNCLLCGVHVLLPKCLLWGCQLLSAWRQRHLDTWRWWLGFSAPPALSCNRCSISSSRKT